MRDKNACVQPAHHRPGGVPRCMSGRMLLSGQPPAELRWILADLDLAEAGMRMLRPWLPGGLHEHDLHKHDPDRPRPWQTEREMFDRQRDHPMPRHWRLRGERTAAKIEAAADR